MNLVFRQEPGPLALQISIKTYINIGIDKEAVNSILGDYNLTVGGFL